MRKRRKGKGSETKAVKGRTDEKRVKVTCIGEKRNQRKRVKKGV